MYATIKTLASYSHHTLLAMVPHGRPNAKKGISAQQFCRGRHEILLRFRFYSTAARRLRLVPPGAIAAKASD